MKKMIAFLLSFVILITFGGVRECLAMAVLEDVENPNMLGESSEMTDEMTDIVEIDEEKESFWEKSRKGLECIGGLAAFAGLVAGGCYILNLFRQDKAVEGENLEISGNQYELDAVKEYMPEIIQMNQIEQVDEVEIATLFFDEAENLEEKDLKEEEKTEDKPKRKELAISWNLNAGVLTISGTGAMIDYSSFSSVPWNSNRNSITSVIIGDGVESIGDYAFWNCKNLASVSIGEGVISIGDHTFSYCSSLTSVNIGEGVTSIGDWAFYYCSSLTSVNIEEGVTSIGDHTFSYCSSLTSVNVPSSVTLIGDIVFNGCSKLMEINVATNNANYASENGVLFNKNLTTLIVYPAGQTGTSYTIPSSIMSIGSDAFFECSNLTSVDIPSSVTSIGSHAFAWCSSLKSVSMPSSVTSIGFCAFYSCSSLTSVNIEEGVASIGSDAFGRCNSLTSVDIPSSVMSIGYEAFGECSKLTEINVAINNANYASENGVLFNKDLTTLIKYPAGKTDTSYTIPSSVMSIGDEAFSVCSRLTSVDIPSSVMSIGDYAFSSCSSLTSVTYCGLTDPDSSSVNVFIDCSQLNEIEVLDNYQSSTFCERSVSKMSNCTVEGSCGASVNFTFKKCTGEFIISGTGAIANRAYRFDHFSITSIVIGEGVTSIGSWTFASCSKLTSVDIPSSVTSIGFCAFGFCSKLTSVTYCGLTEPTYGSGVFAYSQLKNIKVPIKYRGTTFCGVPVEKPSITPQLRRINRIPGLFRY